MLLNVLQVADIAGAAIVPTMERRRRRKNFNAALQAHQDAAGQFEGDFPESSFDAKQFRTEQNERQEKIDDLMAQVRAKYSK